MNGLRKRVAGASSIKLTQEIGAFEIKECDLRVHGMRARELGPLLWGETKRDAVSDFAGHFALHSEHIAQFPVVGVCPQMAIRGGMNELSCNAHPVARAHYRTLDERVDAQFAGNLR